MRCSRQRAPFDAPLLLLLASPPFPSTRSGIKQGCVELGLVSGHAEVTDKHGLQRGKKRYVTGTREKRHVDRTSDSAFYRVEVLLPTNFCVERA